MFKKILGLGIILFFASFVYAQEQITITTYYPSPYGSYNQLQTNSLGVGDNDNDGSLDSGDVPTTAGDVWIKGNVGIGTTSPGVYGGQQSRMDVAGYAAANDVWLKDVGRWVSQGPSPACTFCLSCGGEWPSYQGRFSTDDDSAKNVEVARGNNCSGALYQNPTVAAPISLCCW